ncbi:hypothetical protein GCM10027599_14060 [Yimella radicis]
MTEFEKFTPETIELLRRSVDTFGRCSTTQYYVAIPRDADVEDGEGGQDG